MFCEPHKRVLFSAQISWLCMLCYVVFCSHSWPLFRGDQFSSSIFSIAKFLTGLLSTHGLHILFDPIYNCGADWSCII